MLFACIGCGDQPVAPTATAALAVNLASPPVARSTFPIILGPNPVPMTPQNELWQMEYAVEIRETQCVAVNLTFVEIKMAVHTIAEAPPFNFVLPLGTLGSYDQAALFAQGLSHLAPCQSGSIVRGTLGTISGLGDAGPLGPARVTVRAIGVDEHGHGVGIDTSIESPLQLVH